MLDAVRFWVWVSVPQQAVTETGLFQQGRLPGLYCSHAITIFLFLLYHSLVATSIYEAYFSSGVDVWG